MKTKNQRKWLKRQARERRRKAWNRPLALANRLPSSVRMARHTANLRIAAAGITHALVHPS